jgi:hypothetical protein
VTPQAFQTRSLRIGASNSRNTPFQQSAAPSATTRLSLWQRNQSAGAGTAASAGNPHPFSAWAASQQGTGELMRRSGAVRKTGEKYDTRCRVLGRAWLHRSASMADVDRAYG